MNMLTVLMIQTAGKICWLPVPTTCDACNRRAIVLCTHTDTDLKLADIEKSVSLTLEVV